MDIMIELIITLLTIVLGLVATVGVGGAILLTLAGFPQNGALLLVIGIVAGFLLLYIEKKFSTHKKRGYIIGGNAPDDWEHHVR